MAEDKKSWVKVYTIFDEVTAQMLKSLLEDNGICVDGIVGYRGRLRITSSQG